MEVLGGPVVVLDGADCAVLGRQLVEALRLGYVARGAAPPRALLDFADQVNRADRSSASGSAWACRSGPVAEPRNPPAAGGPPSSGQPVLTATEAARAAEVSAGYLRRVLRRGDVEASRGGPRGSWLVHTDSLAAWIGQRREETKRKAA